ncbi:MAG: hypothetical protein H0T83_09510 [Chthoniobacterales bacterium]|nr:hypothetical protein [Chthoniobacterales bacterium]
MHALRTLDIFHPWESIDEQRICRRCGQVISGRDILIFNDRPGGRPARLECPTTGCPAVPFEWMIPEPSLETGLSSGPLIEPAVPEKGPVQAPRANLPGRLHRAGLFQFLRVPRAFI